MQTVQCILLTGGIASGKSTVSNYFSDRYQIQTIDTDHIARQLTATNSALGRQTLEHLRQYFQDEIDINLHLDRNALRTKIFSDPQAKQRLESILHPLIYQVCVAEIQNIKAPYCLIAIPLLYPNSIYLKLAQYVISVETSIETQIQRLSNRDQISTELANTIILSQPSKEQRFAIATHIINTSHSIDQIYQQCDILHQYFINQGGNPFK